MEKTLAQHPSPATGGGAGISSLGSSSSLVHIPAALAGMEKGASGGKPSAASASSTPAGTKDITTGKLSYLLDQMKCVRAFVCVCA